MNEHEQEQKLLAKVRSALDCGLDQLDPVITERLRKNRLQAVELVKKKPARLFLGMPRLIPVGGFTTLAIAAVAVSVWFGMRPQPIPNKVVADIEVLTVQGNLEMYNELDFFQMLAQTHDTP